MVFRGRVQNGVVVLDAGARLPDGQEVIVLTGEPAQSTLPAQGAPQSLRDIPPVSLGPVLRPLAADDDLLGEMLEGRS